MGHRKFTTFKTHGLTNATVLQRSICRKYKNKMYTLLRCKPYNVLPHSKRRFLTFHGTD